MSFFWGWSLLGSRPPRGSSWGNRPSALKHNLVCCLRIETKNGTVQRCEQNQEGTDRLEQRLGRLEAALEAAQRRMDVFEARLANSAWNEAVGSIRIDLDRLQVGPSQSPTRYSSEPPGTR